MNKDKIISRSSFLESPVYYDEDKKIYFNDIGNKKDLSKYYEKEFHQRNIINNTFRNIINKVFEKITFGSPYNIFDLKHIKKNYALSKSSKIFEIGPGKCDNLKFMKGSGYNIKGIEMDKSIVSNVNSQYNEEILICGNYERELIKEKYDVIILNHVLEHFINIELVIDKLKNNLSENGIVYIRVPNCLSKKELKYSIEKCPHTFHFTPTGIKKIFEDKSYSIINIGTYSRINSGLIYAFFLKLFQKEGLIKKHKNSATDIVMIVSKNDK